jgi:large subunit ribosomal protein L21
MSSDTAKGAGSTPAPASSKKAAASDSAASSSAYAIVEASGQQFWLQPNRYYDLDRLAAEVGDSVSLDTVLLLNDGSATNLGQPYVAGAKVTLKVMEHRRGPKVIVYKMRPKKKTRRKNGHRQELTRVMVESIAMGSKTFN